MRLVLTEKRAFEELVRAAEGVPREAIDITAKAALRAGSEAITINNVRTAAWAWFQTDKEAAVRSHPDAPRLLTWIIEKVIRERRPPDMSGDATSRSAAALLAVACQHSRRRCTRPTSPPDGHRAAGTVQGVTATPGSVDVLLELARSRFYGVRDNDDPGAAHSLECEYEWMLSDREGRLRIDGLGKGLHADPADAVADAAVLREAVLALGFTEQYRCEVTAARVEDMDDHTTLGWRGRIDLGLRRSGGTPT